MAFRPDQINGIHYLVSDNSGSFPNWGVYLSGSAGSGKLFSFYNISSTVSCSVSSSTVFVTGSNYFVDAVFEPAGKRTYINIEGNYDAVSILANGTGSLATTGSLFIGNLTINSSQAYSGSIYNIKIYSTFIGGYNNYRTIAQRIQKIPPVRPTTALALVVGGGGSGGNYFGGGGGAGGFVLSSFALTPGIYNVLVGQGGTTGGTGAGSDGVSSSFSNIVAFGGGGGGGEFANSGRNGGSGGGSRLSTPGTGSQNQGNSGGNGGPGQQGGGGGGAGTSGGTSVGGVTAAGGAGLPSSISGVLTYYAGGGGGGINGSVPGGVGGIGGGGNGGNTSIAPQSGQPNTGGGSGGASALNTTSGGSGIVIIRYPGTQIATGGTVTSFQGDTIHTFTATGSSTFTVF
jgi:hypothetical protein